MQLPSNPEILTTTVGSYSPMDWLIASPSEQALLDATSAVIHTQKRVGIDFRLTESYIDSIPTMPRPRA